ncbi:uncharacterized protein [Temnothorax longispinosus]|uniref:uncharacterized protein n=1 Tax=Temnothorax longispinosus TaxID=300112 RepID=UPI003A993813
MLEFCSGGVRSVRSDVDDPLTMIPWFRTCALWLLAPFGQVARSLWPLCGYAVGGYAAVRCPGWQIGNIMLPFVIKLHAAALSSLRSEVAELNSRLVTATRARETTEAALMRAEVQAARTEQRAEQQAARRHEERLTELHSVIAELGRQLERHRATVIAEDDESEVETSRDRGFHHQPGRGERGRWGQPGRWRSYPGGRRFQLLRGRESTDREW